MTDLSSAMRYDVVKEELLARLETLLRGWDERQMSAGVFAEVLLDEILAESETGRRDDIPSAAPTLKENIAGII